MEGVASHFKYKLHYCFTILLYYKEILLFIEGENLKKAILNIANCSTEMGFACFHSNSNY